MGRDSCDTTTNAVAYTAYARVKVRRPCQKRSGMPSSHAAISSACVTSTADPRACHIADDGDCKSDAGRLDASLGASHPQEDMGPQAIRSALGLLALTAGLVGSGRIVSRHYLFPTEEVPAVRAPDDVVRRDCRASDGVRVHALEIPAPAGGRTIVYFHNNRETIEERVGFARRLRARGFGVLLVEYRGYGFGREASPSVGGLYADAEAALGGLGERASAFGGALEEYRGWGFAREASPSEDGLYADAEAALEALDERGTGPERVVLWGTSLGTGVAAEMARRERGARLVLVSPYTSIPGLVTAVARLVPAGLLVADHFDTLSKAAGILIPTLVIHGDSDEIVPYWMGERLTDAIAHARLVTVAGGHHGDLFEREGERLLSEVAALGG